MTLARNSGWLGSFFGKIRGAGVDLELRQAINFARGLSAVPNPSTNAIDVSVASAGLTVSIDWPEFGAVGDGRDDTVAINKAIDYVGTRGGGTVIIPESSFRVVAPDAFHGAIAVRYSNVRILGLSPKSRIYITGATHQIPIHVCQSNDLRVNPTYVVDNFSIENVTLEGTGAFEYFGLANGRGILMRYVSNATVKRCRVLNMSMIGICAEHGNGPFTITENLVTGNGFTGININARTYGSVISRNVLIGNGGASIGPPMAIQVTGNTTVDANVILGNVADPSNYGGIAWGEGNFHAFGSITNNTILHCRYGLLGIYHGPLKVTGNTIVACRVDCGIKLIQVTNGSFTVPVSHAVVAHNLLINNAPSQIEADLSHGVVANNQCLRLVDAVLPSAPTEPDAIPNVNVLNGILVGGDHTSLVGNVIDGAQYGIAWYSFTTPGVITGNTITNANVSECALLSTTSEGGTQYASYTPIPRCERREISAGVYIDDLITPSLPTTCWSPVGSTWRPSVFTVGQPTWQAVTQSSVYTLNGDHAAGATTLTVNEAVTLADATTYLVGIEGYHASWIWVAVTAGSGHSLTIASGLPVNGAPSGHRVHLTAWAMSSAFDEVT